MDALMRRRFMMLGESVPPTPPAPTLIYSLEEPVSSEFDTNVKLFDTPKSFTILCDATWNNNSSGSWKNAVLGISTSNYFRFGTIGNGKDYQNGELYATANRYSAIIMNTTSTGVMCSSCYSRSDSSTRRRFGIRYNHTTRTIECFVSSTSDTTGHWYTLSSDITGNATLKLLLNSMTGTVHALEVYSGVVDVSVIKSFIGGN